MLVCNVSLRPSRIAIAATVTETANADATTAGLAVFVALVDDPTAAFEVVDASADSFLIEAASASDTVSIELAYFAAVDEAVTATDLTDGTISGAVVARSAMVPGVFVNSGTSREASVIGTMVNL